MTQDWLLIAQEQAECRECGCSADGDTAQSCAGRHVGHCCHDPHRRRGEPPIRHPMVALVGPLLRAHVLGGLSARHLLLAILFHVSTWWNKRSIGDRSHLQIKCWGGKELSCI